MAEPPYFDGREPLTKELMNDLVETSRRQKRLSACPPMEAWDLGDGGQVVRLGAALGTSDVGSGFWGRLVADDSGATWTEVIPGYDPVSGEQTLIDRPGGRTGSLDPLCSLLQGMGNFRPVHQTAYVALRFVPSPASGTIDLSYRIGLAGTPVSVGTVNVLLEPSALQEALNAPAPGRWSVSGTAGTAYYCALDPAYGEPRDSTLLVVANGTSGSVSATIEEAFSTTSGELAGVLYNFLPGGQAVWIRPIVASDGSTRYLFSLPYCGFWARLGSLGEGGYSFVEQVQSVTSVIGFLFFDDPSGIRGTAQELDGETLVPPDTIVWISPFWKSEVGWVYLFSGTSDWRLVIVPDVGTQASYPAGANCLISEPRRRDVKSTQPYAQLLDADGGVTLQSPGTHLAVRAGLNVNGFPVFLRASAPDVGWSGTLTVDSLGTPYVLTIVQGRVSEATP